MIEGLCKVGCLFTNKGSPVSKCLYTVFPPLPSNAASAFLSSRLICSKAFFSPFRYSMKLAPGCLNAPLMTQFLSLSKFLTDSGKVKVLAINSGTPILSVEI